MAVVFYQTETSALFCLLDRVESHFYHILLSLDNHIPTITLTEEVEQLLKKITTLQFSPSKKPVFISKPSSSKFDVSIVENWRLPDIPVPKVLTSLRAARASLESQSSSYQKLMLGVRESYTSRGAIKGEKSKSDKEARLSTGSVKADKV